LPSGAALPRPRPSDPAGVMPARDPFTFAAGMRRPPVAASAGPGGPGPPPPLQGPPPATAAKGHLGFPRGFLAIVDNQIVKAGDTVSGYRVERITEDSVVLRERGGGSRVVTLPALSTTPPGAPRR